jgi:CBS domain-containing protein
VVARDLSEQALSELLERHPYRHFPVMEDGSMKGIASRAEIAAALAEHRQPKMEEAFTCQLGQSIRESQTRLIQSTTGTLAITDESETKLLGLVTLHDLLRAQLAVAEREGSPG